MKVLDVKTNYKTSEVFYDNVSENILFEKLNLKKTVYPCITKNQIVVSLKNEKKIVEHYIKSGFTHINDPDSVMQPYSISDHISFLDKQLKMLSSY